MGNQHFDDEDSKEISLERLVEVIGNVPNCNAISCHFQWNKVKENIARAIKAELGE